MRSVPAAGRPQRAGLLIVGLLVDHEPADLDWVMPGWIVVALVLGLLAAGPALSGKRMRAERRLVRAFWKALTGR